MRLNGQLFRYTSLSTINHIEKLGWKQTDEYYELLVAYTLYQHSHGTAGRLGSRCGSGKESVSNGG
jgi:hypothetical protein